MQILSTFSISKLFNKNQSSSSKENSITTLFDDLPPAEKAAALAKLDEVVSAQPKKPFNWKYFLTAFMGISFSVCAVIASVALAIDVDTNPSLVAKLRMANTNLDRMNLLPDNSDWLFDFTKQEKYTFSPGGVVNANAATFPATVGNGLTMAMLNLGPCAMLPPHFHPRASNYVVSISGTTQTYMIAENGARVITETLDPGKMTIFPQGSVHTMMNTGCENAQLISALSSDDAGTNNLATSLFMLPSDIVLAVLGGGGLNFNATELAIPPVGTGSNTGPEDCLAACHKKGKMIKRTW